MLVDSNVLMYAAGADHPAKRPSLAFLERVARGDIDAAIDAEILQEILHRYRALRRWPEGPSVYDAARRIFPTVFPITDQDVHEARTLLDQYSELSARDAIHAAVALRRALPEIVSFDRDFDAIAGLTRREPA